MGRISYPRYNSPRAAQSLLGLLLVHITWLAYHSRKLAGQTRPPPRRSSAIPPSWADCPAWLPSLRRCSPATLSRCPREMASPCLHTREATVLRLPCCMRSLLRCGLPLAAVRATFLTQTSRGRVPPLSQEMIRCVPVPRMGTKFPGRGTLPRSRSAVT
jgi:hypothetical protein